MPQRQQNIIDVYRKVVEHDPHTTFALLFATILEETGAAADEIVNVLHLASLGIRL